MFEKTVDPFYCTKAWRAIRRDVLRRDHGMCVECLKEFEQCDGVRPRAATLVHHIIPRSERPDLALVMSNLESLCDEHHAQAHPEKGLHGPEQEKKIHQPPAGMIIVKI